MKGPSPNMVIFFEISLIAPLRSVSNYNAGACSALSMLCPRRCCVHESRARAAPWRAAAWRRDVTQQQPRQSGHRHGTELVPRRHYDVMQISDTSDTDTSVHYTTYKAGAASLQRFRQERSSERTTFNSYRILT